MALQLFDRVQVAATANTTVSFSLGTAVTGYRNFSVLTNGDTTYYGASDGTNWEVGIGTYVAAGPTLNRTTLLSSSTGSLITFPASLQVWIDYPAPKSVYQDSNGYVGINLGTTSATALLDVGVSIGTSNGINVGAFNTSTYSGSGAGSIIQSFGARADGNTTFQGRFGAAYRRTDGTAIPSTAKIGMYAFGGQWGLDTTYQSAKLLYAASINGVAEGSFTSATTMPTAITFNTGSTGDAIGSYNLSYGTERMRIDSNGNVGINTTSPSTYGKFAVVGAAGTPIINYTDGTVNGTAGYITGSVAYSGTRSAHMMGFLTNDTGRMWIDSNGNVSIGTASTAIKFSISGTDAMLVPVGTTAQRPTGAAGYFRYNSDLTSFEGYNGTAWSSLGNPSISTTAPSSPVSGNLWWDSTYGRTNIYYNDGTSSQWAAAQPSPDGILLDSLDGGTANTASYSRFIINCGAAA
jgi:hypothetical protein